MNFSEKIEKDNPNKRHKTKKKGFEYSTETVGRPLDLREGPDRSHFNLSEIFSKRSFSAALLWASMMVL